MTKKVLILIGTRPNFIKVTQFRQEARKANIDLRIVHTGQHYDHKMSGVFFEQFNLSPDHFLDIPQGISSAQQLGNIILELDEYVSSSFRPDLLLVVGDVNSTLAGAIFANKTGILLGHVESGLRSRDESMPEEINRILTDRITDFFFVTEQSGYDNLIAEGTDKEKIFFVGNTMIDTLVAHEHEIDTSTILNDLGLGDTPYALMTMHRPATVDYEGGLLKLLEIIKLITKNQTLVFPIHPRTQSKLEEHQLWEEFNAIDGVIICPPTGYFEFQKLIKESVFVVTDSGGIQEETTFRQIPCLTLRSNTERPSTTMIGSNTLVPFDVSKIVELLNKIRNGEYKKGEIPPLWDGKATERIVEVIRQNIFSS